MSEHVSVALSLACVLPAASMMMMMMMIRRRGGILCPYGAALDHALQDEME